MPDSNIPHKERMLLRWVGALCYAAVAVTGWVGASWPVTPELDHTSRLVIHGVGYFTAVVGVILVFSVVLHRWRMEYILVWWASLGISAYIGIAAAVRPTTHGFVLIVALSLFACLTLISRGISLSLFAARTKYSSGA